MSAHQRSTKRDKVKHSGGGRRSKKDGAGGKGTWGSPTDDMKFADSDMVFDQNDPNYDEELAEKPAKYVSVEIDEQAEENFRTNMKRIHEFKENVKKEANDFLKSEINGDLFITNVRALNSPGYSNQIGKILISLSLDYTDKERARVSELLKIMMKDGCIAPNDLVRSFNILLSRLHDLMLDVPNAKSYLNEFAKRAEADFLLSEAEAQPYYEILGTSHDVTLVQTLKTKTTEMLREYFTSESIDELCEQVVALDAQFFHSEIVKRAVSMSLDLHNRERELVSRFLARTCDDESSSKFLKHSEVTEGFMTLLHQIGDLSEDVPQIDRLLSSFIARAIADECLAPSFIDHVMALPGDPAYTVLELVKKLKEPRGSGARLARIWGHESDSTSALKESVHALIHEFFASYNFAGAHKAILALEAPHFHHEVVKQIFMLCVEKYEKEVENVAELLSSLVKEGVIIPSEITLGLQLVEKSLPVLNEAFPIAQSVFDSLKDSVKL